MKHDVKTLFLNIVAGVLTYYVTKFLDNNDLPYLSYFVFALYIVFIFSTFYFHYNNPVQIELNASKSSVDKPAEQNKENNKPDIFHKILPVVAKLASQHVDATPKVIGELISESPQIVLAYLKEMSDEFLVVYTSGCKQPDINTPFFIAYHENPWKYLKIQSD